MSWTPERENKLKELRGMSTVESENHIIICRFIELSSSLQLINELRLDPQTKNIPVVILEPVSASRGHSRPPEARNHEHLEICPSLNLLR